MNIDEDLQHLRLKISRIETELADAKYQLSSLDERFREIAVEPKSIPGPLTTGPVAEPSSAPVLPSRAIPPPLPVETTPPPETFAAPPAYAFNIERDFLESAAAAAAETETGGQKATGPAPAFAAEAFAASASVDTRPAESAADFAVVETTPDWKLWLQRLQLWPPADGQSNEVRLGAWWATRLGAFLAVIGVVFFGVYVSLNTPPWIKFAELCAICAGVAVTGLWLEKRIARFGAVVFGGGLALVYFCAFAGYALPAVKVLTSPAAAVGWQLAAVLLIAGASIGRRSQSIATMAVGLGFVTAIFSRAGGLHDFALVTAGMLAVASVVFHRWLHWEAPSVVALPGAYAVYYLVLEANWSRGGPPSAVWPWLFLAGVSTLFFLRDWRSVRVTNAAVGVGEKWFQGANSSLAVLLGVVTSFMLYRGDLAEFYLGAAFMLGLFAWLRRAQVEDDTMSAVFVAKASGAFTLGVIEVVDGRTTALALLVQAWVMLFCARKLKSRVLAVGCGMVAAVSTLYFFGGATTVLPLWSINAASALAFVVGLAWLPTVGRRMLTDKNSEWAGPLEMGVALVAALAAVFTIINLRPPGWEPALMVGVAAVLGLPVLRRGALAPLLTGCVLLLAANCSLWLILEKGGFQSSLIANAVIVLVHGVWIGALCGIYRPKSASVASDDAAVVLAYERSAWALLGLVVWGITLLGVVHVFAALMEPGAAVGSTLLMALTLGLFAPLWRGRGVLWLTVFTSAAGTFFWMPHVVKAVSWPWIFAALCAAWALPIALHASRRHLAKLQDEPQSGWLLGALLGLAINVMLRVLPAFFAGDAQVLACAVAALVVFGLSIWPRIAFAVEASWVLWCAALLIAVDELSGSSATLMHSPLTLLAAAVLSWLPVIVLSRQARVAALLDKPAQSSAAWWRRQATGIQTFFATLLTFVVCAYGFHGADRLVALVLASIAAVSLSRFARISEARWSSLTLLSSAFIASWFVMIFGQAQGWSDGLVAILLVAGALIAVPLVVIGDVRKAGKIIHLRWWFGAAALALVFVLALAQRGTLAPYATVGWGLASIMVFMTGLFARARPYRMLGLLGLALCVPRMFVVDLDSALHRIAAFVVLGLVLLWVGFSYHRFRHLITEESDGSKSP